MLTMAVVGSRSFDDKSLGMLETNKFVDNFKDIGRVTKIVSGGAKGADLFGKMYAGYNRMGYIEHLPDWDEHGKAAGMIRNRDIINDADCAIIFWDGTSKGTKNSIDLIRAKGIPYSLVIYEKELTKDYDKIDILSEWE